MAGVERFPNSYEMARGCAYSTGNQEEIGKARNLVVKRHARSMTRWAGCWLACALAASGMATAATRYVVTNDDQTFPTTGVSFHAVGANGALTLKQHVSTGGFGIGGGYFGANRISVLDSGKNQCVFASEAATGDIVGIDISTLTAGPGAKGSETDAGTSNGIGLVMNDEYLYASFTDSSTIGTFKVEGSCSLTFVSDTKAAGLQKGVINGMAVHDKMLIATYSDGTIESFDIASGPPIANADKQYSTAYRTTQGASYANSIDITKDGKYAVFGDTSTSTMVEVSDISAGKLTKTVVYTSSAGISSSNVMLSPDETLLYIANTQGASVTAMRFDKTTGKLSTGCTSGALRGLSAKWSYLGGLASISGMGNGGGVYVAEFGSPSGIAVVTLDASGAACKLKEAVKSPVADPNSSGLLSIGSFPPRSF
jgi:6-phosphogluconolactonase (cycloisomerase 2 family)